MGTLNFKWEAIEVPLESKVRLYEAMTLNLLLWGSENGLEIKIISQGTNNSTINL